MTTSYPTALDTFTNPTGSQILGASSPTHSAQHANLNDAVLALETKVGTGVSVKNTGTDSRFGTGAAGAAGAFARVGDEGDASNAYLIGDGTGSNIGVVLRSKGTGKIQFQTSAGTERVRIDDNGGLICSTGALATAATDGFFYARYMNGVPSGVPTVVGGAVPLFFNISDNKMYAYNGGWVKSAAFA